MTDDGADVLAAVCGRDDPARRVAGHEAFGRLYERHAPVVRALCRDHTSADHEVDDAVQETFIRAYRKLHEVQAPNGGGFRSWLYAIARLVCAERRRAWGRRAKHETRGAEVAAMNGHAKVTREQGASPSAAAASSRQDLDRLTQAMETLSDDERLALHLYYVDTDPVASAGDALGLSRSGFYKLLAGAREKLAAKMNAKTLEQRGAAGVNL